MRDDHPDMYPGVGIFFLEDKTRPYAYLFYSWRVLALGL